MIQAPAEPSDLQRLRSVQNVLPEVDDFMIIFLIDITGCHQKIRRRFIVRNGNIVHLSNTGSCGCAVRGSEKKIIRSTCPSTTFAPICWSPPRGPLLYPLTGSPVLSVIILAVVPVPHRKCWLRSSLCFAHHSIISAFFPSWAIKAIFFCFQCNPAVFHFLPPVTTKTLR